MAREGRNRLLECANKGHRESECWKKRADLDKARSSQRDTDRRHQSHFAGGSEAAGLGPTLVMNHKTNQMATSNSKSRKFGTWTPELKTTKSGSSFSRSQRSRGWLKPEKTPHIPLSTSEMPL